MAARTCVLIPWECMTCGASPVTALENLLKNVGNAPAPDSNALRTVRADAKESPTRASAAGASTTQTRAPRASAAARKGPLPSAMTELSVRCEPSPARMEARGTDSAPRSSPEGVRWVTRMASPGAVTGGRDLAMARRGLPHPAPDTARDAPRIRTKRAAHIVGREAPRRMGTMFVNESLQFPGDLVDAVDAPFGKRELVVPEEPLHLLVLRQRPSETCRESVPPGTVDPVVFHQERDGVPADVHEPAVMGPSHLIGLDPSRGFGEPRRHLDVAPFGDTDHLRTDPQWIADVLEHVRARDEIH